MVQAGLLTPRFVACLSMTDFSNPVFSERRAAAAPLRARGGKRHESGRGPGGPLRRRTPGGRSRRAQWRRPGRQPGAGVPVQLGHADYEAAFVQRITDYFLALKAGMADPDVVDGWFRLAEYRRRRFRRRPLAEFA